MIKTGKSFKLIKCIICKKKFKRKKKKGLNINSSNIRQFRAKTCSKKCAREYHRKIKSRH